jgi:spore coat polysaccharide biosynthesis protein SpsF (cytidylyltransferase family)
MAEFTSVIIGIQARSTSTRLPRKCFEMLGDKPVLQHVIDACVKSASYMNKHSEKTRMMVRTVLVVPEDDEIIGAFKGRAPIAVGPELDVLERYNLMAERFKADYIVRVTGDCPLIPAPLITKHITTAVKNSYDYCSNVDVTSRIAADGMDCEVISRKMLVHAAQTATDPSDREHVTPFVRRNHVIPYLERTPNDWARTGAIIGPLFYSREKFSVDTHADLERVREAYAHKQACFSEAERLHGKQNVHSY